MAVDFSKFNFFNKLDARARVLVVLGAIIGFILLIYLSTRYFLGSGSTTGPSRVAGAPPGAQSIPGGQLTPEYQRALEQANIQQAQQAQMQGTSAIPTAINYGGSQAGCIICTEQTANVKNLLDDWVKKGQLNPDVASALQALADKNVTPEEYAAYLDRLVREGKLTPEQARQLLDQYRRQHANRLLQDSAGVMDNLIKNGQLPLDAATDLLSAQKKGVSPSDYGRMLQDMVHQGTLSPETAQQLLGQYTQQRAKQIIQKSIVVLQGMASKGQITPDILRELIQYETQMVPVDTFAAALQKYVAGGRMTPIVSAQILDEYNSQKQAIGPSGTLSDLLAKAEAAAYQELTELVNEKKITPEVAAQIAGMIKANVSYADFQKVIDQLVLQKKLTPAIAKLKLADYLKIKNLRDLARELAGLQANNASPQQYADALKRAVESGALTPEEAAQLMRQYQAFTTPVPTAPVTPVGGTAAFQQLQQRLKEGAAATTPVAAASEFAVPVTPQAPEVVPVSTEGRQARIDALMAAMSGQAQQLVNAWQPPVMEYRAGAPETKPAAKAETAKTGTQGKTTGSTPGGGTGPVVIKAGTIYFAVLDTQANSDYPNTPILATIVQGPFKGAKLMGKLQTEKNIAGQLDRISITFTLMDEKDWDKTKSINAFAIDPDTARTVMASSVNYHYLKRYGAIMATSLLQGYAGAVTTSGSTTTTGIFGTTSQYPTISPANKLMVALGQVGQTMSSSVQAWINIPPTVRVDAGVSIGILFMSDVT